MLEMKNVSFAYKNKKTKEEVAIFKDFSYAFEKGKIYAIYGQSGAGKTTCLSIMGGFDKPDEGSVSVDGVKLSDYGLQKVKREKLSFVFQDYQLFPYMTAIENVMVAKKIKEKRKKKEECISSCISILSTVGIEQSEMKRVVSRLSGGQQQRVAIARALVNDVDYILADEPTGNLDEENTKNIMNLLCNLAHEKNKCVIVVTHSSMVRKMCDAEIKIDR